MQHDRQCDLATKEHLTEGVAQIEVEGECEVSQSLASLLTG